MGKHGLARIGIILLVMFSLGFLSLAASVSAENNDKIFENNMGQVIAPNEDESQQKTFDKDELSAKDESLNKTQSLAKTTKSENTQTAQDETPSTVALVNSQWGTSPVSFDDDTGILIVNAGTIVNNNDLYLDNHSTIAKINVKHIVFENGVVAPSDMSVFFQGGGSSYYNYFGSLISIQGSLDTSSVTNMSSMFWGASNLTSLDISNWNTTSVTNMSNMFNGTSNLASLDVSNWDTSSVTNMSNMFWGASNLASLDVSNWDTSKVTNMSRMFYLMSGLTSLDVSNWDTSQVTNISGMFSGDSQSHMNSLAGLDMSNWDTGKVTSMKEMFYWSSISALDLKNWNTSQVKDMSFMFANSKLKSLDASNWNTSNVNDIAYIFMGTRYLVDLKVSNWNLSKTTDLSAMFFQTSLKDLDISGWDTRSKYVSLMLYNSFIEKLTLGENTILSDDTMLEWIRTDNGKYTGKWERIDPVSPESIYDSTDDFMNNYDGSMPGTYVWQKASHIITYELDGGVNNASNPSTYTYGTGVSSFADASKTGYDFLGWYDASDNAITNISTTDTGNKTLYAKWQAKVNIYTITYELDGGINDTSNPISYTYGTGVSSFADATKVGYDFLGWVDASNNPVTNIPATETGNRVLYATWQIAIPLPNEVYIITYELDGGINEASNPVSYTYGTGVSSFVDASKTGYDFLGWYDANNNHITSISATDTGNKTLYAKWKNNSDNPENPGNTDNGGNNKNKGNNNNPVDKGKPSTLPQTGNSNTPTAMLMFIAGLLISGGYLITRKKGDF